MQVIIEEKFELAVHNPETSNFEGGSLHASVIIDDLKYVEYNGTEKIYTFETIIVTEADKQAIQSVIDEFDHSTICDSSKISAGDISAINHRYTVLSGASNYNDMMLGLGQYIAARVAEINSSYEKHIVGVKIWSDKNDYEYFIDGLDDIRGAGDTGQKTVACVEHMIDE